MGGVQGYIKSDGMKSDDKSYYTIKKNLVSIQRIYNVLIIRHKEIGKLEELLYSLINLKSFVYFLHPLSAQITILWML